MLVYDVARAGDDAAIRRLLRENPMDGNIRVAFAREPDAALAAGIAGESEEILVLRETPAGPPVAMGCRSVYRGYVNGTVMPIGYLSLLRVDRRRRGPGIMRSGYETLRRMHQHGPTPWYLTTIVDDNLIARRLLERGLPGMPTYRALARLVTLVLPVRRRWPRPERMTVMTGAEDRVPAVADFLQRSLSRFQFAPYWTQDDFSSEVRTRDLSPRDFVVIERNGEVAACAAVWDQRGFKQAVVHGYSRRLAVMRPLLNPIAPLLRIPRLPPSGESLRYAYLSHLAVVDDDPATVQALVAAAHNRAMARSLDYLTVTLAERHPFVAAIRNAFPCREYRSTLFLVHWDDEACPDLDARTPYLETARL